MLAVVSAVLAEDDYVTHWIRENRYTMIYTCFAKQESTLYRKLK